MKWLKRIVPVLRDNVVEITVLFGLLMLFAGLCMIYTPLAFVGIGTVILLWCYDVMK